MENLRVVVRKFKHGNTPLKQLLNGFLRRQLIILSPRWCQNIRRARAAVYSNGIKEFCSEAEMSLREVDPAGIVNYYGTAMIDYPDVKKMICRRGTKRSYGIIDYSRL